MAINDNGGLSLQLLDLAASLRFVILRSAKHIVILNWRNNEVGTGARTGVRERE